MLAEHIPESGIQGSRSAAPAASKDRNRRRDVIHELSRFLPDEIGEYGSDRTQCDNHPEIQFAGPSQGPGGKQEQDGRYRETKLPRNNRTKQDGVAMPGKGGALCRS